jgi:hypothetical protein
MQHVCGPSLSVYVRQLNLKKKCGW